MTFHRLGGDSGKMSCASDSHCLQCGGELPSSTEYIVRRWRVLSGLPFVTSSVHSVYGHNFNAQPEEGGFRYGTLSIPSLLFADDVVLLASSCMDLQLLDSQLCLKRLG